jgi:hypothetical protein
VAGGRARPLLGHWTLPSVLKGRDSGIERWGWCMSGSDGTARARVGPSGSARRYRPHYHMLLKSVGDSDVAACDWSV